ncbi:FAD-binding protein [Cellulomonas sp. IC4_254]|uniref:FAD-binding oxidoreductase n=1 Tax=Cellulomonas sp. IC4_254 TaxID=2714040 RepID=UPI0014224EB6|nr:FAD-binding protein [Cellulomonas sp. IC4_254]NHT16820.1 FAD-binding oxidoreductase [Cellulomonas sp. IC4_254]
MTASPSTQDLADLRSRFSGRVVPPDDPDYDALRVVVVGGVDPRPAVITRPRDDADVAAAVAFARDAGLPLAVRSGGHSGAGHGTVDGGLVIDLRDMRAVDVDPDGRTAWVEAGATAGETTAATAAHGLAVGFGDTGSVGVGGITLGGGVGFLSRAHGLTVDNLLAADVVLADGRVVRADAEQHPELFWALRGGGGNLGVVTRFRFRLHPLDGVTGGMLLLPASAPVVAGFLGALQAGPDELTAIVNVLPCPPLPFVPAEHHGSLVVMALVCWSGPAEAADAALAPIRALATPIADLVHPVAYPELFPPADPEYHPTAVARTLLLDHVDLPLAEAVVSRLQQLDGMRVVQLRALGGAIGRVPADATAFAHRSSRLMGNVAAFVTGSDDRAARTAWVEGTAAVLHQGDTGAYVNFLGDEGPERVRAAYPGATWDRLAAAKAVYDPGNLFRRNQNVPPAGSPGADGA